jgi:hypothetical protein
MLMELDGMQKEYLEDLGRDRKKILEFILRKKLALTSPTSGGRSVGIVRLRTKSHGV